MALNDSARYLRMYRAKPSMWVKHHIDITPAKHRSRAQLEAWLETVPPDSHLWCRKQLAAGKLRLDGASYQDTALDVMARPGFYAFQWANGLAKTATASLFVHHFLDCYPGGKLLTTAGTWSQLKEQLWREIATWSARAKMPIVANIAGVDKTQIDIAPDWAAFGRAADKAYTFEGVHAPAVAVVMDEAKAISPDIFDAVRRILRGNPGGRFWWVCLSSPGSPSGPFYDITTGDQAHRWTTFKLSAYESERVDLDQIEQDRQDLGETSPLFIAMNIGEFPDEGDQVVLPLSLVQAAVDRTVTEEGLKTLGVDVSRFGGDETAMVALFGRRAQVLAAYTQRDTVFTEGKIRQLWAAHRFDRIGIDDTGLVGVTDHIKAANLPVDGISFGSTEGMQQAQYYTNIKAEMYFQLKTDLEEGARTPSNPNAGLSIPNDKRMIHQLSCQQYRFLGAKYRMESHEELKRRGEKSPDRADALALANLMRIRGMRRRGLRALGNVMPQ